MCLAPPLVSVSVWPRGIHLLQRENKYDESRHYLNMLLDATKQLVRPSRPRLINAFLDTNTQPS